MAILGSHTLDVMEIDFDSLRFGPEAAEPRLRGLHPFFVLFRLADVNRDGHLDLVPRFQLNETGLTPTDRVACLRGEIAGTPFEACGAVEVPPDRTSRRRSRNPSTRWSFFDRHR